MPNYCKVIVIGHAVRDAELKTTQGGVNICELGVAFNNNRKDARGQWTSEPCFLDCTAFSQTAERMSDVRKGDAILVEGKLKQDNWTAQDGTKRSKIRLVVDHFSRMGGGRGEQAAPAATQYDGDDSPF